MILRSLATCVALIFTAFLVSCGGGSGRAGTDVVVTGTGPATVTTAAPAVFTITVTNAGSDGDADDVTLRNQPAYPLSLSSITCVASGGATCPDLSVPTNMLVPVLPHGSSLVFTVTDTLAANAATGTITVTDTMSAQFSSDSDTSNNTATIAATATYLNASVTVTGVGPSGTVAAGGTAVFTMTVTNAGPDAGTNLVIDDSVQGPLTLTAITCTASGTTGTVCPAAVGIETDVPTLPSGGTLVFTVTAVVPSAQVPKGSTAPFANKMDVRLDNDTDTSDNSVVVQGSAFSAIAGVFVTGVGPNAVVPAGGTTSFIMTVTNSGPGDATSTHIIDTSDGNFSITGITCAPVGGATCPAAPTTNMTIDDIPAGGALVFTVGATIKAGFNGTVTNTMTATATNDTDTSDNTATAVATTVSDDIAVTAVAPAGPVAGGSVATFTMTAVNNGPGTATDVVFNDTVSTGLTLGAITCTATGGAVCPTAFSVSGDGTNATMTAPTMPASSTLVFSVPTTVTAGATGTVTNTLLATATGDSKASNNQASAGVNALSANLGVSEVGMQTVAAGSSAVFNVVVSNPGPTAAQNVSLVDTLTAGYTATVTCTSTSGAVCPSTLGMNITIPTMKVGDVFTFTYTVPVPSASRGAIVNTVVIASASDPDTSNNTASFTTTAVNGLNGTYIAFAADGNQYQLAINFDALSYTMSGNGQVWNETFQAPTGTDSSYQITGGDLSHPGGAQQLRTATDLIVGNHDFNSGAGLLPYVAARSFVTSLTPAQGSYDLASRNLTSTAVSTHVGTGIISNNTLSICQTDTAVTRPTSCSVPLTTYLLTQSGNVFTGVNADNSNDVYNFYIAKSGALAVLLSAGTGSDGSQQLRIGLPDSPSLVTSNFYGPQTNNAAGDWNFIALSPSTYAYTSQTTGATDNAALQPVQSNGGPFAIEVGAFVRSSQLIYVLEALPLQVTVAAPNTSGSGFLQISLP